MTDILSDVPSDLKSQTVSTQMKRHGGAFIGDVCLLY